jgi:putative membrane protein insertion efficiency factor
MNNLALLWIKPGKFCVAAVRSAAKRMTKWILLGLLGAYRSFGSLFLGGACRFEPSCSEYAQNALKIHDSQEAVKLIAIRVCKCRPGGPFGFDPVPLPKSSRISIRGVQ